MPARRTSLPEELLGRPFTAAQARDAGVGRRALQGGAVRRPHRGLYVAADHPDELADRVAAALRVLPAQTIAVGVTALALLGVECGIAGLRFATTWRHPVRRAGLRVSHVQTLPPNTDGRALAPYAFVGAATDLDLIDLIAAGDQLTRRDQIQPENLIAAAAAARGRGCVRARRAAALVRDRVDSPRETWLRLCLVLAGLPEPAVNQAIGTAQRYLGRPDLSYPRYRVLLEYEGDQHRSDRRQWAHDLDRYADFAADGWTVLRVADENTRHPRQLVWRTTRALRDGGYPGPDPHFPPEWHENFS